MLLVHIQGKIILTLVGLGVTWGMSHRAFLDSNRVSFFYRTVQQNPLE